MGAVDSNRCCGGGLKRVIRVQAVEFSRIPAIAKTTVSERRTVSEISSDPILSC